MSKTRYRTFEYSNEPKTPNLCTNDEKLGAMKLYNMNFLNGKLRELNKDSGLSSKATVNF